MINRGLLMPEEERTRRQAALYKVVTTHTSHTWAAVLVRMLLSQIGTENAAHQTPFMEQSKLESAYNAATRRLLLFDYDVRVHPLCLDLVCMNHTDANFGDLHRELLPPS
jgi:trehalose 6-phosphate synthase/phosphatase